MAPDEIEREMIDYYEDRAKIYDEVYTVHSDKAELDAVAAYLCGILAGRSVLEVACGTGYWTERIAGCAKHVCATDGLDGPLGESRKRLQGSRNVTLKKADAYTLEGVDGDFDAALHVQWYSHVPLQRIGSFLDGLHARLNPGATVVMSDSYFGEADSPKRKKDWADKYQFDSHGNAYAYRALPGGKKYRVYKNMPTRVDLEKQLQGRADDFRFKAFPSFWVVSYRTP